MAAAGDIWSTTAWPPGWTVDHVTETGSTNTDLLTALEAGTVGDRAVLATAHQTAGRGRLDRRWDAPPGANLLVSVAFAPVPDPPSTVTQRVGLAAATAAAALRPDAAVTLKWPNDVLLDDVKLAGVLAQRCPTRDAVVVGLGMNVGWAPDGAAKLGQGIEPSEVLARVLAALDDPAADVAAAYRDALGTLGRRVRIELPDGVIEGLACDLDARGRLIVETDGDSGSGVRRAFDVGDVVHLRRAD
jgi:BirA family biotin operon repressor/biotin-[acetyl-CoA-carboxylase] ligase